MITCTGRISCTFTLSSSMFTGCRFLSDFWHHLWHNLRVDLESAPSRSDSAAQDLDVNPQCEQVSSGVSSHGDLSETPTVLIKHCGMFYISVCFSVLLPTQRRCVGVDADGWRVTHTHLLQETTNTKWAAGWSEEEKKCESHQLQWQIGGVYL